MLRCIDRTIRIYYYGIWKNNKILCGGDWCLVVPLVFKTSVGSRRSRVGSIPIRLRHLLQALLQTETICLCLAEIKNIMDW